MANLKEVKENNVKLTNSNRINKIKSDIYDIIKEEVDYKRRSRCTLSY